VTQDDLLYRFRLRVFAMAQELGNVRAACRAMGIHPSTHYRWKRQLDRLVRRSCDPENVDHRDGQCHQRAD
jgi:transposase-like protein